MTRGYEIDHHLSDDDANVHHEWDDTLDPAVRIESGDVVRFECRDALDGQIKTDSTAEEFASASFDPVHPLTGPVYVAEAEPGDVLEVELLDLETKGWGYTGFFPGEMDLGLLPEEFEEAGLHVWDIEEDVCRFVHGIEVPCRPFPGIVGNAPATGGPVDTLPPRDVGGNMDVKHMSEGSTVYLPVEVEGALFSTGDCHAAQGDGEVCVTGIEAPMFVTARFHVRKDMDIEQPQFETDGPFTPTGRDERMYATTGIDSDLMEATKKAVRHMIDHCSSKRGLTRSEAYILCSAAVDLKINEVVDAPNWTVSAYLPESIFPADS
jgi:acetamidase/formamidase